MRTQLQRFLAFVTASLTKWHWRLLAFDAFGGAGLLIIAVLMGVAPHRLRVPAILSAYVLVRVGIWARRRAQQTEDV